MWISLVEAFERDLLENQRLSNLSMPMWRLGPRQDKTYAAASLLCLKKASRSALIWSFEFVSDFGFRA
jgi:hypothetical protein